jgi:hypothetical protein
MNRTAIVALEMRDDEDLRVIANHISSMLVQVDDGKELRYAGLRMVEGERSAAQVLTAIRLDDPPKIHTVQVHVHNHNREGSGGGGIFR